MREKIISDIENYVVENQRTVRRDFHGLNDDCSNWADVIPPKDQFAFYLEWNGILGYASEIIEAYETLVKEKK